MWAQEETGLVVRGAGDLCLGAATKRLVAVVFVSAPSVDEQYLRRAPSLDEFVWRLALDA